MARARRAKTRPARVAVPIAAALLAIAAVLGAQQGWFSRGESASSGASPTVLASRQTAQPTTSATPATPAREAPAPSTTASSEASTDDPDPDAEQALEDCRASVEAADDVLKAADTGIGHWSEHVQAQTDANEGDISESKMDAIFQRTRSAGDDDVRRYEDAVDEAVDRSASCTVPAGAPEEIATELKSCAERDEKQQPVLEAAKDAMEDWESHLADMRRSSAGHLHNARGVWLRTWRAAPRHIKAYDRAEEKFDAPRC